MGIDDFMTLCKLLGAEPYIAVNSGFGDAHSASEEVEYVNGTATTRLGALRAAAWLRGRASGRYSMADVLGLAGG